MDNAYFKLINFLQNIDKEVDFNLFEILDNDKKDIKLSIDIQINNKIKSFLELNYTYPILSEESIFSKSYLLIQEKCWILDPLDGSLNLSRKIPISCISIALWNGEFVDFACIYDFNRKEVFVADKNKSLVNNVPCQVSSVSEPSSAVLCTGFPSWRSYDDKSLIHFLKKIQQWKKIRAIGSAAISLTWVARGWIDACIEEDIRIWDVIAGLALVKSAGGQVFIKPNDKPNFVTAIATNENFLIKSLL